MASLHVLLLVLLALVLASTMETESVEVSNGVDSTAILGDLKAKSWSSYKVPLSGCPGACNKRCSATSKRKACMFFCSKCCSKCLCVPPGTYGNKQVCPCYNNWKTQQGGPKCP